MTAFFGVHLVLTVVSLTLGTIIGVLGFRALRSESPSVSAAHERELIEPGPSEHQVT